MQPIALSRANELIQVTDTLERLGQSPERILAQAKLPMWHFSEPEDLIPAHHISYLMDQAARSLGSPTFGLLVGADSGVATLGAFGKLVSTSVTPYHAVQTCCRLIHLHTSAGGYWLTEAGDEFWFCGSQFTGPEDGRREMEQACLMRMINHVGMAAGPSWRPAKIRLQTRETPDSELREALGDPEIRIGQKTTAFAIPRRLLAQPLRQPKRTLGGARETTVNQLRHSAPGPGFVESLRQLTETMLKEGAPKIETMAEIIGLSVRSLQRRLAKNGISHSQIVDQARYQAATRLLRESDSRITDIGIELGYADSAHFSRAFKRWSGITPREYRRHQLAP